MTDEGRRRWRLLKRNGPMTARQIAELTNARRETVFQWCRRTAGVVDVGEHYHCGSGARPRLFAVKED